MKPISLTTIKPSGQSVEEWIGEQFQRINEASSEDPAQFAVEAIDFDESLVTILETFDPSTATATEMRNVVSTFLLYLRRGAPNKTQ